MTRDIFPKHDASLHLTHNQHKAYYEPVETWLEAQDDGTKECWFEWVSPEQRQKAIATDSVWTLQWYPATPNGFCALAAADLWVLLAAAQDDAPHDNAPKPPVDQPVTPVTHEK